MFARAKLNLSLRVLAREVSGYHQIETVFCLLELADELALSVAGRDIVLDVASAPDELVPAPDLGPAATNLVVRAAVAFRERTGIREGAHIRLVKRIPVGAGLGGGSSDAAATLEALNALHGEPLARTDLIALAGTLGSDVAFFTARTPLALAWGRGDRIAPLPALPPRPVLLLVPPRASATANAYAALAATRTTQHVAAARLVEPSRDWSHIAAEAINDFEPIVFREMPELEDALAGLRRHGAVLARMTGSGSTVFGVFEALQTMRGAQRALAAQHPDWRQLVTRTAVL